MKNDETSLIIEHLDKRLDDLRTDMKDDIGTLKEMLAAHLNACDKNMGEHDKRLRNVEAHKNKANGAIAIIGFIVLVFGVYVISKWWS